MIFLIEFLFGRCYSLIMRSKQYTSKRLLELFKAEKIATMEELKAVLGTRADATVFRKLGELSYRTSYSHNGKYYTLDKIAKYDEWGLWSFRAVWFSSRGTLLSTAEALIQEAESGFFASELELLLQVEVRLPSPGLPQRPETGSGSRVWPLP